MRIAIVNDMPMAAEALRRVISGSPNHSVAWIVRDGAAAVERCRQDTPDLVLMDLMMPILDGVEATRQIMLQSPCPILIVTATVNGHSEKVFEALGAGALDVVQTPILGGNGQLPGAASLLFKVGAVERQVSGERQKRFIGRSAPESQAAPNDLLIGIGASAGGPAALAAVLSSLPRDFSAAIVIIQHLDAHFVPLMVNWLNERSAVPVQVAQPGDRLRAGVALIAGTDEHLVLVDHQTLDYASEPKNANYHPSIDVFFQSAARFRHADAAGVLLTGMGQDGAKGLKALRKSGCLTIAQNEQSCAVYGMPKAAAELDAAMAILPLEQIVQRLISFAQTRIVQRRSKEQHG